jgi:uncharacterized membrane protein YhaH (DUF805 family)
MDFKQAVIRCLRDNYANFNGRAARPEFWWFMLASVIVAFVLGLFNMNMLALLFNLAVLVPSLAVGARRLHDIGKSGWFQLLVLIPLLGWILLIYWFAQPTTGPNEFGEGPATVQDPAAVPPGAV